MQEQKKDTPRWGGGEKEIISPLGSKKTGWVIPPSDLPTQKKNQKNPLGIKRGKRRGNSTEGEEGKKGFF